MHLFKKRNKAHEEFKRFGSLRKHSNPIASLKRTTRKLQPRNKKKEIDAEAETILNDLISELNTKYPSSKKSSLSKYGFTNSSSTGSNKQKVINADEGGAGGKHHTYATISHFKTPGSFRKSTQRNKSPGYAKLVKRNKKSTSPTLRTLRRKNNVRDLIKKINQ